jgi:hypothetical protein
MADAAGKEEHLAASMGNPLTFFEGEEPAAKYATALSMFLTGEWKLNEMYDRIGCALCLVRGQSI